MKQSPETRASEALYPFCAIWGQKQGPFSHNNRLKGKSSNIPHLVKGKSGAVFQNMTQQEARVKGHRETSQSITANLRTLSFRTSSEGNCVPLQKPSPEHREPSSERELGKIREKRFFSLHLSQQSFSRKTANFPSKKRKVGKRIQFSSSGWSH